MRARGAVAGGAVASRCSLVLSRLGLWETESLRFVIDGVGSCFDGCGSVCVFCSFFSSTIAGANARHSVRPPSVETMQVERDVRACRRFTRVARPALQLWVETRYLIAGFGTATCTHPSHKPFG